MTVFEKMKKIIAEVLDVKETEVLPETVFINDLGADSLDFVALLQELETEFNIQIPDEDAQGFKTVKEVVKYIETKVNNKN